MARRMKRFSASFIKTSVFPPGRGLPLNAMILNYYSAL